MSRRRLHPLVLVVVLLLVGAGGRAEPSPDAARLHYRKAKALHEVGRYGEAIEQFELAFRESGRPELLFNIGQSYRLKGEPERAAEYYERFLALQPTGPLAETARSFLGRTKPAGDDVPIPPEPKTTPAAPSSPPPASPTPAAPMLLEPGFAVPTPAPPSKPPADASGGRRLLRIGSIVVGGVGLALVGLGTYYAVQARSTSQALEQRYGMAAPWDASARAMYDEGGKQALLARVMIPAGGAFVVTGAVLAYFGWRQVPRLVAEPSPRGFALSYRGSF